MNPNESANIQKYKCMEALRHFWPPYMIHPHLDVMQEAFGDEEATILKTIVKQQSTLIWECGQDVDDASINKHEINFFEIFQLVIITL